MTGMDRVGVLSDSDRRCVFGELDGDDGKGREAEMWGEARAQTQEEKIPRARAEREFERRVRGVVESAVGGGEEGIREVMIGLLESGIRKGLELSWGVGRERAVVQWGMKERERTGSSGASTGSEGGSGGRCEERGNTRWNAYDVSDRERATEGT